jgi:hypothetical protein
MIHSYVDFIIVKPSREVYTSSASLSGQSTILHWTKNFRARKGQCKGPSFSDVPDHDPESRQHLLSWFQSGAAPSLGDYILYDHYHGNTTLANLSARKMASPLPAVIESLFPCI